MNNQIGDRVDKIFYRKGRGHACDIECRAAGHRYHHTFSKTVPITLSRDGKHATAVFEAKAFKTPSGEQEPFLVNPRRPAANPPLIIINPRRRKKKAMAKTIQMRRNGKGQFVAVRRSNPPKKRKRRVVHHTSAVARQHHKKRRRNPPFWTAGALINHRKKRRNNPPSIAGIPLALPEISDVLWVSAGIAGPPIAKGFALQMMPSLATMANGWVLEGVGYAVPAVAGYMIGGTPALRKVLLGEAASVFVRLTQGFMAQAASTPAVNGFRGYLAPGGGKLLRGYTRGPVSNQQLRGTPARSFARSSRFNSRY